MPRPPPADPKEQEFVKIVGDIRKLLGDLDRYDDAKRTALKQAVGTSSRGSWLKNRLKELRESADKLEAFIKDLTPSRIEKVQITLGRSDSIAKFFAFIFVHQPRYPLPALDGDPFFGSGVYAIYYKGKGEPAYLPLSNSETPIYIGKADPESHYAETTVQQGQSLYLRLREHGEKSIRNTALPLEDFEYRFATVQSGMQASVEEFLIRLFRPIWNKEVKISYGIGKHGDSAATRGNKRSPWDTMHPGRNFARATLQDQTSRGDVVEKIAKHFETYPPFRSQNELLKTLTEL